MTLRLIKLLSLSILVSLVLLVKPVFAYPKPIGFVNDFADVLSSEFEENLENKLTSFRDQQGPEVVVVTVKTLEGDVVENYAVELFNQWNIGKKGEDNGVLFLVAIEDRKMRIEVGYGAEANLNDAKAGRIIRNTIAPEFKNEDYEAGIEKGTEEIIASLKGLESEESPALLTSEDVDLFTIFAIFFFSGIFIYLVAFLARSKSWWAGGVIGFIIGIITSLTVGIILGLIGLILDYILSQNYKKLKQAKKSTGFWPTKGGFWTGGGKSSGGFGGFSGGSSGGGGASGSW